MAQGERKRIEEECETRGDKNEQSMAGEERRARKHTGGGWRRARKHIGEKWRSGQE